MMSWALGRTNLAAAILQFPPSFAYESFLFQILIWMTVPDTDRTLEISHTADFSPLTAISHFATLVATYTKVKQCLNSGVSRVVRFSYLFRMTFSHVYCLRDRRRTSEFNLAFLTYLAFCGFHLIISQISRSFKGTV